MAKLKEQPAARKTCLLELPVTDETETGYLTKHVDVGSLSKRQSAALRRVNIGLQSEKAQFENGRFVKCNADVVRYILEQIGMEINVP